VFLRPPVFAVAATMLALVTGWTPNAWWGRRSHARVAWRSRSHPVVRRWLAHGFRWTYGVGDSQHFDAVRGSGRVIEPRGCPGVCH
jgi:hypothetical protein